MRRERGVRWDGYVDEGAIVHAAVSLYDFKFNAVLCDVS